MILRFSDLTGFAPSGKAFAIAAIGAVVGVVVLGVALIVNDPITAAKTRGIGFGPGWTCDQHPSGATVCFRRH